MSEAYEIGISLALEDGVSAGIEHARREIALLRDILNTGGVPLQRLRETAQAAVAPQRQNSAEERPDAPAEADRVVSEPATECPTATRQFPLLAESRQVSADLPPIAEIPAPVLPAPVHLPYEAHSVAQPQLKLWQDFGVPAEVVGDRAAAETTVAAPDVPAAVPALAQPGLVKQSQDMRRDFVPAAATAALMVQTPAAAPVLAETPQQPASAAPLRGIIQAAPADPQTFLVSPAAVTAPADPPGYAAPTREAMPTPVLPEAPAGPQAAAGVPQALPPPAAPRAAAASAAGPTEGDVFLDGMLVGRWMSRFLSRESGRASAGPTGFDARRGRLMPGPTVGG